MSVRKKITESSGLVGGAHAVSFSLYLIKVTYSQHDFTIDVNLDHLTEIMLGFYNYREGIRPPPLSILSSGRKSLCKPAHT